MQIFIHQTTIVSAENVTKLYMSWPSFGL